MSTTYTGSPTTPEAPASAPDSITPPILTLPADGDALNAASIAQLAKCLANEVAFERLIRATGGDASGRPIKEWLNELLNVRAFIDHNGFPAGKYIGWNEYWDACELATKNTISNGNWGGRWAYSLDGSVSGVVGAVDYTTPTFDCPTSAAELVTPATGTAAAAHVEAKRFPIYLNADTDAVFEWDFTPALITPGSVEVSMGLAALRQLATTTTWSAGAHGGAALVLRTGDTHWQCYSCNVASGTPVYTDTGLAANATTRFRARIEVKGANAASGAAAHVMFWLMGSLKADITLDISNGLSGQALLPFFRVNATATTQTLLIGPNSLRSAGHWPGNIVF